MAPVDRDLASDGGVLLMATAELGVDEASEVIVGSEPFLFRETCSSSMPQNPELRKEQRKFLQGLIDA